MANQTYKLPLHGGCYCGHIQYEIVGEVLKEGVCHCRACQQLTGGACWPFLVVNSESLHISGDLKEFTRKGASGQKVHVGFCPECGSTLFGRPEVWPTIRTVSASSLDNPEFFSPSMHVWTEAMPSWMILNPDVPQFLDNPNEKK